MKELVFNGLTNESLSNVNKNNGFEVFAPNPTIVAASRVELNP
jgi:hypothetical protein